MSATIWLIIATLCILIGFAGTILPLLPGAPLAFAGFLIIAWVDDFQRVGWVTLTALGILSLFTIVVDILASTMGAQRAGASKLALIGAALGTIFGLFLGPIGLITGPFIGAAGGEFLHQQDALKAGTVGMATVIGFIVGSAIKIAVVFAMCGLFVFGYFA